MSSLQDPQESGGRGGRRSSSLKLERGIQRAVGWTSCWGRWSGRCRIAKGSESVLSGMDCMVLHRKTPNLYWPTIRAEGVDPSASLRASQGAIWTPHLLQPPPAVLISAEALKVSSQLWLPGCRVPAFPGAGEHECFLQRKVTETRC